MPHNSAAWLGAKRAQLDVRPAPYTAPGDHEIVVRNHAVAINPLEWIIQSVGGVVYPWIRYPFVLGSDLAGEVVEVGSGVTRFRVGDRVLGHAVGSDRDSNSSARGAFQHHTVVLEQLAAPIPDTMAYEDAAVLPLGLSTAACGLFQTDQLALNHPSASPSPTGQTLVVWGGSTSVGSNAIQLAVAAGYDVVTTASPRNFDYVRRLGASRAFDYHSPTVVAEISAALQGRTLAGAFAIGYGSAQPCADIVHAGQGRKFVATASTSLSFADLDEGVARSWQLPALLLRVGASTAVFLLRCRLWGIATRFVIGTTLRTTRSARPSTRTSCRRPLPRAATSPRPNLAWSARASSTCRPASTSSGPGSPLRRSWSASEPANRAHSASRSSPQACQRSICTWAVTRGRKRSG